MKKIINVILVIVLLISIGFNIYFCMEIKNVTKIENDLIEEISKLGNELDKSKETLNSKDIEITELETQISSKEEKIKGIQESLLSLESEKEKLIEQIEDSKIVEVKEIKGNSQTGEETQSNANVSDEPSGGISPEEAAAKFGMTFDGSGLDTSGFNHGDGGYGVIHE